jgi:hypothetical protein
MLVGSVISVLRVPVDVGVAIVGRFTDVEMAAVVSVAPVPIVSWPPTGAAARCWAAAGLGGLAIRLNAPASRIDMELASVIPE